MTRKVCTVNPVTRGTSPDEFTGHAGAEGDGYSFVNDGKTIIKLVSTSGSGAPLVFSHPGKRDALEVGDLTITVALGVTRWMGPFPTSFNQAGDNEGLVFFTCADASTTIYVVRI